jgi:hypothetical protein
MNCSVMGSISHRDHAVSKDYVECHMLDRGSIYVIEPTKFNSDEAWKGTYSLGSIEIEVVNSTISNDDDVTMKIQQLECYGILPEVTCETKIKLNAIVRLVVRSRTIPLEVLQQSRAGICMH